MRSILPRTIPALLVSLAAASVPAGASCMPAKYFSSFGSGGYVYLHTPAAATNTFTSLVGRFWQPGAYGTTGEGACAEQNWLIHYPASPTHTWYLNGTLGSTGCATSACPTSGLIVTLEDKSTNGQTAYFAAGRVDETAGSPQFDFSRSGGDWTLVPIPFPNVTSTTSGEVFQAFFTFADPAPGFHGSPGLQASGTITAFLLYTPTSGSATRERSTWTFVKRVPYTGGITQGQATLVCPSAGTGVRLAAALEFDNGQVLTHYVSLDVFAECDTYAPGSGAVDEGGSRGLFVRREATGDLTLSWGPSCSSGDQGFEVYEGQIGDWDSHAPVTCSVWISPKA